MYGIMCSEWVSTEKNEVKQDAGSRVWNQPEGSMHSTDQLAAHYPA